jgi:hypothetical protein
MDDLIYLIILIAWVVFAFYRKSQKKGQAAKEVQERPIPRRETGPLPTLEEILLGREPQEEPEVETVPRQTTISDGMAPVLAETAFEKEYNRKGIESIEEMDRPFYLSVTKEVENNSGPVLLEDNGEEEWLENINLRQAVIYAEILNRPYA